MDDNGQVTTEKTEGFTPIGAMTDREISEEILVLLRQFSTGLAQLQTAMEGNPILRQVMRSVK